MSGVAAESHRRDFINSLRRQKFGISETGKVLSAIHSDLHSAVSLLAVNLYSKECHFLLELIQNAADNQYPEGTTPSLTFSLSTHDPTNTTDSVGCLMVFNNEIGFSEPNIAALCSVGQSTKRGFSSGFVGEKGIGFKSTFVVSRRPHIFSNGFKIAFTDSEDEGSLGFIVPEWVDVKEEWEEKYGAPPGTRTVIALPLRSQRTVQTVAKQLKELDPEVLLCIPKLEVLSIIANGTPYLTVTRPRPKNPQFVELKRTKSDRTKTARYMMVRRFAKVMSGVEVPVGRSCESCEFVVALPLPRKLVWEELPSRARNVFAFLPTEMSSGTPCVLHADWHITASREAINLDVPWNNWCCIELKNTLFDAFKQFSELEVVRNVPWVAVGYLARMQESAAQHSGIFFNILKPMFQLMQNLPIVFCMDGQFRSPAESVVVSQRHNLFRKCVERAQYARPLITGPAHIEQHLVHSSLEMEENIPSSPRSWICTQLGIRSLISTDILAILADVAFLPALDTEGVVDLHRFLKEMDRFSEIPSSQLASLPLVPTIENGDSVCRSAAGVYRMPQEGGRAYLEPEFEASMRGTNEWAWLQKLGVVEEAEDAPVQGGPSSFARAEPPPIQLNFVQLKQLSEARGDVIDQLTKERDKLLQRLLMLESTSDPVPTSDKTMKDASRTGEEREEEDVYEQAGKISEYTEEQIETMIEVFPSWPSLSEIESRHWILFSYLTRSWGLCPEDEMAYVVVQYLCRNLGWKVFDWDWAVVPLLPQYGKGDLMLIRQSRGENEVLIIELKSLRGIGVAKNRLTTRRRVLRAQVERYHEIAMKKFPAPKRVISMGLTDVILKKKRLELSHINWVCGTPELPLRTSWLDLVR